jgi:hypothetical protein
MTARRPQPPPLPATLAEIARLVGRDRAVELARRFGGEKLEFPHRPRADHRVARTIGLAAARILGDVYMGDRVAIPHATSVLQWHEARRLRARGMTVVAIARRLYLSTRAVERWTADVAARRRTDHRPAAPPAHRRAAEPPLPLFAWAERRRRRPIP